MWLRDSGAQAVSYTHLDVYKRQVDGDAKRRQSVQVHQQVVDHIFHLANIVVKGEENLPKEGLYTFVSNHPLGGQDGVALAVSYTHLE